MLDSGKIGSVLRHRCWIWARATYSNGYGHLRTSDAKDHLSHKYVWESWYGKITEPKMVLHHACENKLCYNPYHLRLMSARAHMLIERPHIFQRAATTHCPSGHEYTEDNILWSNKMQRVCRECNRIQCAKQSAKRKHAKQASL